jgi:uncharacterized protein with HEPN domain
MTDRGNKYLTDILQAITLIESFTAEIPDYNQYMSDLKTKVQLRDNLGY